MCKCQIQFPLWSIFLTTVFAAICVILVQASLKKPEEIPRPIYVGLGYTNTEKIFTKIQSSDFENSERAARRWKFILDEPTVIETAKRFLRTLIEEIECDSEFRFQAINQQCWTQDQWFWMVRFEANSSFDGVQHITIVVLPDGTIVKPTVSERTDLGWPHPDTAVPKWTTSLTNLQIVQNFSKTLNSDRLFLGKRIFLVGTIQKIPYGHEHQKSSWSNYFVLSDGTRLICTIDEKISPDDKVSVKGQLVGFRMLEFVDFENVEFNWDTADLVPGIRVEEWTQIRNSD